MSLKDAEFRRMDLFSAIATQINLDCMEDVRDQDSVAAQGAGPVDVQTRQLRLRTPFRDGDQINKWSKLAIGWRQLPDLMADDKHQPLAHDVGDQGRNA